MPYLIEAGVAAHSNAAHCLQRTSAMILQSQIREHNELCPPVRQDQKVHFWAIASFSLPDIPVQMMLTAAGRIRRAENFGNFNFGAVMQRLSRFFVEVCSPAGK
jgi:hypothetical protein